MGCHSGLSVSDITIGQTNEDWAQALGQQGSLFVGNTGFGYGDTETVAYTERLMALFAERVTEPFEQSGGDVQHGRSGARLGEEPVRRRAPGVQRLRREGAHGVDVLRSALLSGRERPGAAPAGAYHVTAPDATGTSACWSSASTPATTRNVAPRGPTSPTPRPTEANS